MSSGESRGCDHSCLPTRPMSGNFSALVEKAGIDAGDVEQIVGGCRTPRWKASPR